MTNWFDIWGAPKMEPAVGFTFDVTEPFNFATSSTTEWRFLNFINPSPEISLDTQIVIGITND